MDAEVNLLSVIENFMTGVGMCNGYRNNIYTQAYRHRHYICHILFITTTLLIQWYTRLNLISKT